MGFIKSLFCNHDYEFVRNIHGDEIEQAGGKRSWWRCRKCGKWTAGEYYNVEQTNTWRAFADNPNAGRYADTREKLEKDVRLTFGNEIVRRIIMGFLDRQAAITKRETLHDNPTRVVYRSIGETPETGASEDEIRDSDIWSVAYEIYRAGGYVDDGGEPNPPTDGIRELLKRQASITERHWMEVCGSNANIDLKRQMEVLEANNEQLHTLIAELQADNDYLRDCNKKLDCEVHEWRGEAKNQRNNFEQATKARKHWQSKYESLKATSYSAEAPSDESEIARELGKALAERDMYRDKLGRAIDAAHGIVGMVNEE